MLTVRKYHAHTKIVPFDPKIIALLAAYVEYFSQVVCNCV